MRAPTGSPATAWSYIRALSGDGEIATVVRTLPSRVGGMLTIDLVNVRRLTTPSRVRTGADFGDE